MKVIYVSNFFNFHQSLFWDNFVKHNPNFTFLTTMKIEWAENKPSEDRNYCVKSKNLSDNELKKLFDEQDVIIMGLCLDDRIFQHLDLSKPILLSKEHYFKQKNLLSLRIIKNRFILSKIYKDNRPYILSYSSFIKRDLNWMKFPHKEIFKLGYYPPINNDEDKIKHKKKKFIFIGRLLDWKRPILAIEGYEYFSRLNLAYFMEIYGDGPEENSIKCYLEQNNIKNIRLGHSITHENVLNKFLESEIFIFSSDNNEGWGAVLNEAMSCGCVVFACTKAGSTNYLVKDGVNGFTFKDKKELFKKLEMYSSLDKTKKEEIRLNAFNTINSLWNEKIAAERLNVILNAIVNKESLDLYNEGPLSIDK